MLRAALTLPLRSFLFFIQKRFEDASFHFNYHDQFSSHCCDQYRVNLIVSKQWSIYISGLRIASQLGTRKSCQEDFFIMSEDLHAVAAATAPQPPPSIPQVDHHDHHDHHGMQPLAPQPVQTAPVDALTCQWIACGERCSTPEALYVGGIQTLLNRHR